MRLLPLISLLLLATGCSKKPEAGGAARGPGAPVPVNIGEAVTRDMPLDLRVFGHVEPIDSVGVKAQVGGELIGISFEEGQEVKRGDLLFTIQPKLYSVQLAQAAANVARDRAAAENARREAERSRQLARKGAVSNEELDRIVANAEIAEATLKADEALLEIARVRLGYATIEAPIDGRTGALQVSVGNLIKDNADTPMVTINQVAPIYVTFSPLERFLPELRKGHAEGGLTVTAVDPKTNQPLARGTVTFIDNTVDASTGNIMLKATFPNEDRALWPGAFVDVLLRLRSDAGVTVVPASAVTVGQRGPQVFVIKDDGTAELRAVAVGRTVNEQTIIEKGVASGEKVVINGQSRLVPGARVTIKPADPGASTGAPVASAKGGGA